jgi:hypothetical protein
MVRCCSDLCGRGQPLSHEDAAIPCPDVFVRCPCVLCIIRSVLLVNTHDT